MDNNQNIVNHGMEPTQNDAVVTLGKLEGLVVSCPGKRPGQEEVASMLEKMRQNAARRIPSVDGAEKGDDLIIDFTAEKNGELLEDAIGEEIPLRLGEGMFIPEFEEQLLGLWPGEEKDVTVTFPSNYPMKELADQQILFHVTLRECSREIVPELDDKFAKEIGGMDSLEALQEAMLKELDHLYDIKSKNIVRNQLIKKAVDGADVMLSEEAVEAEVDLTFQTFTQKLEAEDLDLNSYLEKTGLKYDTVREELREEARNSLKTTMVLEEIAAQKNLVPTEEAINEGLSDIAGAIQCSVEELREKYPMAANEIISSLKMEMAIEYLYQFADIRS